MGGRGGNIRRGGVPQSITPEPEKYYAFKSYQDAKKQFEDDESFSEWESAVKQAEKAAAVKYTGGAYEYINNWLRLGEEHYLHTGAEIDEIRENIVAAIKKFDLKQNITVFRGGSNKLIGGASSFEEVKALIGTVVRDYGVMSTAVTEKAAWDGMQYEIHVPKGKGRGIWIDPVSLHSGEQEFMLMPGTDFKIVGVHKNSKGEPVCELTVVSSTPKKRPKKKP